MFEKNLHSIAQEVSGKPVLTDRCELLPIDFISLSWFLPYFSPRKINLIEYLTWKRWRPSFDSC